MAAATGFHIIDNNRMNEPGTATVYRLPQAWCAFDTGGTPAATGSEAGTLFYFSLMKFGKAMAMRPMASMEMASLAST